MSVYLDPLWLKNTQVLLMDNPNQNKHNTLRKQMANLLKIMKQIPPVPVVQAPPKVHIDFSSVDSKFLLIEDFTDSYSSSIVLSSTFILDFNQVDVANRDLLNFQVSELSMDSKSDAKTIVTWYQE